jgi:hypothetical protein
MLRTRFAVVLAAFIGWFGAGMALAEEAETSGGLPLVFSDDFQQGTDRWETTDDSAWALHDHGDGKAFGLNRRISDYQPKVRSPHNLALIKDVEVADLVLKLKVKSTMDTGGHRDCCLFFNYQDPTHFYYVHLGASPDAKNDVKLVRDTKQGTIEVYFDDMDKPHMKATDQTFGKGRVGIGSFDDMNDFDDVRLYGR